MDEGLHFLLQHNLLVVWVFDGHGRGDVRRRGLIRLARLFPTAAELDPAAAFEMAPLRRRPSTKVENRHRRSLASTAMKTAAVA